MSDKGDNKNAKPRAVGSVVRSRELTVKTLEKIDALELKSSPDFYELWYRYFEGDPVITRAIDSVKGNLTEDVCQQIYNKYLSTGGQDEAVLKVSDQVQHSIAELATILKTVNSATAEYGQTLEDVSENIRQAETLEDLGAVVAEILEDTRRMVEKNQTLEGQLNSSSRQVSELKQYLETVKKEATTDGLTGVANRKAFDRTVADAVADAEEHGKKLILMMIDIDHFKKFNDTYGHQTGDQVLRLVARTLVSNVKGRDTAARFGGEEFAILLPDTALAAGLKVAETLRVSVEERELVNKSSQQNLGTLTISLGVAEYRKGEGVDGLIARADGALYDAKKSGRNRVGHAK
jgi:diguanylate cyclase